MKLCRFGLCKWGILTSDLIIRTNLWLCPLWKGLNQLNSFYMRQLDIRWGLLDIRSGFKLLRVVKLRRHWMLRWLADLGFGRNFPVHGEDIRIKKLIWMKVASCPLKRKKNYFTHIHIRSLYKETKTNLGCLILLPISIKCSFFSSFHLAIQS